MDEKHESSGTFGGRWDKPRLKLCEGSTDYENIYSPRELRLNRKED